jgi:hypothetical protein
MRVKSISGWLGLVAAGAVALPLTAAALSQATGVIAGNVVFTDGTPAAGALIAVAGTSRGDVSDAGGRFTISQVPAGTRTLRATFDGRREVRREVLVVADDTARIALRPGWRPPPESRVRIWLLGPDLPPRTTE